MDSFKKLHLKAEIHKARHIHIPTTDQKSDKNNLNTEIKIEIEDGDEKSTKNLPSSEPDFFENLWLEVNIDSEDVKKAEKLGSFPEDIFEKYLDRRITFKLKNVTSRTIKDEKAVLGTFSCDLRKIFNHPSSKVTNKWVPLKNENNFRDIVGYLKFSLAISTEDDFSYSSPVEDFDSDLIQSNLFLPLGLQVGQKQSGFTFSDIYGRFWIGVLNSSI